VEEGVPYVQVDSIRYVFDFTDEQRRREWQELGIDPDQAIAENIAADNAVIAGLKRGGPRLCSAGRRPPWTPQGRTRRHQRKRA
jgi:hypothetical protein